MIIAGGDVVFESRDAIEARIKDIWARCGFNVSFEPFSVAQRLVDVWVELLWASQETTRDLYSRLSLNSSGADLDRFVQKLGVQRIIFPQLAFVWRNSPSDLSDRRFTYIVFPTGTRLEDAIRYDHRGSGIRSMLVSGQTVQSFLDSVPMLYEEEYNDNEEVFSTERRLVIEAEIFNLNFTNKTDDSGRPLTIEHTILQPHKALHQTGREITRSANGAIEYRNGDLSYDALAETDVALRHRIITNGLSMTACETMLNQICERSKVELVDKDDRVFKIMMQGFSASKENIRSFFDICEAYLPIDFSLMSASQRDVETGNAILLTDESSDLAVASRSGYYYREHKSVLYIGGLSDVQMEALADGLPEVVSYPIVWIALGPTFTNDLIETMTLHYETSDSRREPVPSPRGTVSSRSALQGGTGWKVVPA